MSVIKKYHSYFLSSIPDGCFSFFKISSKEILLSLLLSFIAVANFAQSTTCDCDYYMYLNDVQGSGSGDGFVHKFRINPNGTFTEIFRNPPTNTIPWFPTGGGLPSPHGLAQDLNGNIYIGEGPFGDAAEDIRKLSCSGTLVPQASFKIDDGGYNFSSRNGIIYVNSAAASNRINAYRICDGSLIGYIRLSGVRNVDGTPQGDPGSPANEDWGFSIAPDGTFYATSGIGDYSGNGKTDRIFRFTPTLADFAAHTLYTSFITSASYPAGITDNEHETYGITSDPAGNMYVIVSDFNTSRRWILKYNSSGVLVDSNSELTSSPTGGFEGARGLAYHAPTNKLYVAGGQDGDCVAIINPANLNYEGPALANVPGQFPKGLAIVKECCPGTTPVNVNENACYTGVSQNYFLSDFTSDCDAPLCAGGNAWTPASGNSSNLVFNACDNSVTVNGPGCGTFTLTNPGVGNACGAFQFTVNLCFNSPPTATVTPQQGTCTGTTPNNNAIINISAASNANQAGFSIGATYSGPAYNGVGTIPVTTGTASFTSLLHNTEYTVRIFNGSNDCYVDYTVTTPTIDCNTVTSCNCKEYIYLNEPGLGAVLKFEVGAGVPLTELIGANGGTPPTEHWYPGLGTTEMPKPHGLGSDLNGKLYIASDFQNPNEIRRLDCDGGIDPISATTVINPTNSVFNIFSIGNALYVTRNGGVASYNSCTGAKIGEFCYNDALGNPNPGAYWGLSYNSVTKMIYGSGRLTDNRNIFVYSESEMEQAMLNGTCIDPFIPLGTATLSNIMPGDNFIPSNIFQIIGITSDDLGNIYIVGYEEGVTPTYGRILKYNSAGGFVGISPQVEQAQGSYGIIWSRDYNRLYVAQLNDNPIVDCISAFSTDLAYLGTAAPNPGLAVNNGGKALAIIKECCPVNLPLTFQREVCGAIGTKFYLNEEAFDLCDGVVCGSSWTPTSVNNMTFDPCDNSVVVNGNGCSTFTLNIGAVSSTACGAQNATFTICNTVIDASVNTNVGTCGAFGANNNASIVISNILNVNQAGISVGNVYSGPAYGTAGTISITGGGTFPNLIHNTYYTVRIFNGSNDCYFDKVILTPNISCCSAIITALPTTCNPNNNQYAVSGQVTFVDAPASGTLTVSISGGGSQVFNAPFTSPINYTINGQTSDGLMKTVTATFSALLSCTNTTTYTAPSNCSPTGTCNCKEYIYLNEPALKTVLKFEIGSGVPLTEVLGVNGGSLPDHHWYPGTGVSELPFPHGLATDLNGNLFVGSIANPSGQLRKFSCDGAISAVDPTTITTQFILTNMFSIGNIIYTTRNGGPAAYNSCTGALIGTMCLNDQNGDPMPSPTTGFSNWGLSYNPTTEMVYVTQNTLRGNVWVFTRAQLEAAIAGGPCIDPFIPLGTNAVVNPGDNFLPDSPGNIFGITSDNAGNIYIVKVPATGSYIMKYNAAGQYVSESPTSPLNGPYAVTIGIVWSETTNRLYVSNSTDDATADCISAFDATTMAYLGAAAPNPNLPTNNTPKAIAIMKECCPVNLPSTFSREVCGAVGTKFYLNVEAFNDCDGIVCGSSWTPTSLTGMTFDPCDNSVTVTGPGCGVFTLDIGAVTSTGCPAQMSTFTICNLIPSGTVVGNIGTCTGATANNDARINLSSVTNADQAGISIGATYTGPSYGGVGTINVSSGSGVFNNLMHNTTYTVRIFNASGTCYVDRTVTTPVVVCCASTMTATPSACNPNNNQYTVSGQVTVTNGPATGTLTVSITGGSSQVFNAPFASPISYSIGGQTSDGLVKTVTTTFSAIPTCGNTVTYTAPSNCSPTTTCNCTEYVYLNEPSLSAVLKFKVESGIPLTEVVGTNGGTPPSQHWYPGLGSSELPSPHGLATDLNGNLYISDRDFPPSQIRKLNCDGSISPVSSATIMPNDYTSNMFSIDNTIYKNGNGFIRAYNSCTGVLIGSKCLSNAGIFWGLSYNKATGMVYAAEPDGDVWSMTVAELNDFNTCKDPIIVMGPNPVINVGENFTPFGSNGSIWGVVGDNTGNIYVVKGLNGPETNILKYNSSGQFIAQSAGSMNGGVFGGGIGIVWSEDTNRLYMSNFTDNPATDCISAFNANTLAYLGTAAPNPNLPTNNTAKAIAIIKECCPVNLPSAFQREVCGAVGTKFYLNQEAFDDCDGTVCGSSWTPSSLNGMTFDPCDNSVTVTGVGCSTFTLGIGAVASTGCAPQNSTFTICNNLPSASFTPISGTCNATGPNNDARVNVINATYANQAGISAGNAYTGPAYGAMGTISLAGGSGTFTGLMHVTVYTIRVFNGSNECYVDFQVNTPSLECCNISTIVPQNIVCYDNDTPNKLSDNKIRFSANVTNSNALLTTYNVSISGGTTITPNSNVPYGITQFTLGAGTAGGGATFTITFTDSQTPGCVEVLTITDPGNCTPGNPPTPCPPIQCGTATIQVNGN